MQKRNGQTGILLKIQDEFLISARARWLRESGQNEHPVAPHGAVF